MIYQKPAMQDVVRVSCMAGFCDEYEKKYPKISRGYFEKFSPQEFVLTFGYLLILSFAAFRISGASEYRNF